MDVAGIVEGEFEFVESVEVVEVLVGCGFEFELPVELEVEVEVVVAVGMVVVELVVPDFGLYPLLVVVVVVVLDGFELEEVVPVDEVDVGVVVVLGL
jgi:hypothetical protein